MLALRILGRVTACGSAELERVRRSVAIADMGAVQGNFGWARFVVQVR
jgi:hypothetical protein